MSKLIFRLFAVHEGSEEKAISFEDRDIGDAAENLSNSFQRQFKQVKEGVFCFKSTRWNPSSKQRADVTKVLGVIPTDAAGMPFGSGDYQDTGSIKDGMKVYAFT